MDNKENIEKKEHHLSYQQQYYIKNKEKIKQYQRKYYQNKKGSSKNYVMTITYGKFILNLNE